ncbi:MAG: MFS transporter, partial [Candidatus Hodarchaeota archaeon]
FYVLGVGAAQILSGFMIDLYPWYVPLIIVSIGGFICIIFLFFMEEPQKSTKGESWITLEDFRNIWKVKSNKLIFSLNFIMFIGIGAISQELIRLLELDYKFSGSFATISLILVFITQIPSGIILGNFGDKQFINDKRGRIKVVLICLLCGSTLYIIGYLMVFPYYDAFMVTIFLIILASGAFFFGGIDPSLQASLGDVNTSKYRATCYAINNLTYTFGRSISLLLLGIIFIDFGSYRPGFIILSIIAISCSLILIPLMKNFPSDLIERESNQEI